MTNQRSASYAVMALLGLIVAGLCSYADARLREPDVTPPNVIVTVLPEPTWSPTQTPFVATPTPTTVEPVLRATATFTPIPFVTTTPEPTETPTRLPATMQQKG